MTSTTNVFAHNGSSHKKGDWTFLARSLSWQLGSPYDSSYLQLRPLPGQIEVRLGEIAEIVGGTAVRSSERHEQRSDTHNAPYLQVRHILTNGEIADNPFWVNADQLGVPESRRAHEGEILVTTAGTIGEVALVPAGLSNGVVFDTSLRLLRIDPTYADADEVYRFLRSEIGQMQFRRLTSGTAIPVLSSPMFASMTVFLEEHDETSREVDLVPAPVDAPAVNAEAGALAEAIQSQIVDFLRSIQPDDTSWATTTDARLRRLTSNLVPKPLTQVIEDDFPTPIAIPYRRYRMAGHNVYERLDRMVNLVESCVYFAFNVLLADYCHRDPTARIALSSEARSAKNGSDIMWRKLCFIADHLTAAKSHGYDVFMPELVESKIFDVGDAFRLQVRNVIAHTAPGSEPYVRELLELHEPSVQELLKSLDFLSGYTLCRVRNHFFRGGQWFYQAEVSRGAEFDINLREDSLTTFSSEDRRDVRLIEADRDHLVLLSGDGEALDLYPFYQLHYGANTGRESHFCFFKRFKDSTLTGESIRSGMEVVLGGVPDFVRLTGAQLNTSASVGDN